MAEIQGRSSERKCLCHWQTQVASGSASAFLEWLQPGSAGALGFLQPTDNTLGLLSHLMKVQEKIDSVMKVL